MKKIIPIFFVLIGALWAQESKPDAFSFVQQLYFENSAHQYDQYLLQELPAILETDRFSGQTEEILWMLASTQKRNGLRYRAFINYYKILFLFPQSKFREESIKQIRAEIKTGHLNAALYPSPSENKAYGTAEEGSFACISFIYQAKCDSLNTALVDAFDLFLKRFSGSRFEDILLFWKGQLYLKQNRPFFAEALFRQILFLYPNSALRPEIMLALADVYWHSTAKFNEAKEIYYELINSFSEDQYGGMAQFYLSELLADSLKNPEEAARSFRLFCQNYPEHPFVALAWKEMGETAKKEKKWLEACNYFAQSYEQAQDDSLIKYDLNQMETLSYRLMDYQRAARVLMLQAKRENSAEKMLRAAELYETRINNRAEARRILQRIIKDFPDSEVARKAKKKLNDR